MPAGGAGSVRVVLQRQAEVDAVLEAFRARSTERELFDLPRGLLGLRPVEVVATVTRPRFGGETEELAVARFEERRLALGE